MTKGGSRKEVAFHHSNGSVSPNENGQEHKEIKKTAMKPSTLTRDEVQNCHREPFINSGYRESENITVRQCIATLFTVHNETFNIWSHLIVAVGLFLYFMSHIIDHAIVGNPSIYPLLCYVIGSSSMFLSSSLAHLFCCMSWKARHVCFYVDYAAIGVCSLGSTIGFIFYCRPSPEQSSVLHTNPYYFLGISTGIAVINTYFCCISRHRLSKYRFLLRTGVYLIKVLFDLSPYWARCGLYQSNICSTFVLDAFERFKFCFIVSAIVNVTQLPERLFPGHFDLLGNSHHFIHVLTPVGVYNVFHLFLYEMIERKDLISTSQYPPTFLTSFGFLIVLTSINCCVVVWFVSNWLQAEEEELFSGSKYLVFQKKSSEIKRHLANDLKRLKVM